MYIHDALSEYITCGDTSFALMNAHEKVKELSETQDGRTGFEKQFEVIVAVTIQDMQVLHLITFTIITASAATHSDSCKLQYF